MLKDRVDAAPSGDGSWRAVVAGPQGRLTVGLVLVTLTVATEALIITAIMPVIVRDIGGLQYYGLAFSAFFLAGLASIPTAGWAVDRYGPSAPFAVLIGIFIVGSTLAALAPSMPVLVLARAGQGYGAAAQFTLTQSTIARAYHGGARVKVLSLMSATWTVPGLVGPALGAAIAATFGWRWAFGAIVAPGLAACLLTYPSLRAVGAPHGEKRPLAVRWPIQVAAGAGLIVLGLTSPPFPGLVVVTAGIPLVLTGLRHTLPAGSLLARSGLPSVVAAAFFLNTAFYAASAFVPLLLVRLMDVSIAAAGAAVSAGTIAWSAGVWLNTLLVDRYRRSLLLIGSALLLALGTAIFASALAGTPLPLAYCGWILAGFGMGICFNTFTLSAMVMAPKGGEGAALSGRNLTGSLGTAMGTGVGGAAVAASSSLQVGLRPALAFVYGMSILSALATAALARRSSPN